LLESELFGHERGAFTGAVQRRIGKFEQAKSGTVFLDEIGELDFSLQAKLLRVIQTRQFERIGGNETITTDARLISATNRDLRLEVEAKRFREDLYFRLSTFPIILPPLRQRPTDILLLADHFLRVFGKEHGKPDIRISRGALRLLAEYPWPGNVRELENVIQRAIVMVESTTITEKDLPLPIQAFRAGGAASPTASLLSEKEAVVPIEKRKEQAVRHALKVTGGNIAEAAKKLGLGRATLYRLMRKYRISGRRTDSDSTAVEVKGKT
jgi:transcriptional regulator with GAF, ATPase, and Fis domain